MWIVPSSHASWIARALSAASALLNLAGWAQYLRAQAKGWSVSSAANWLASLMLVVCAWLVQSRAGRPDLSWMYAAGALACLLALLMSLRARWIFTRADLALLALSGVLLLALWKAPAFSIAVIATYYLVNYTLFVRNILTKRTHEHALAWVIWMCAATCMLLAQPPHDPKSWVLPATNLLCWSSVLAATWWTSALPQAA